jgi:hypothetical protein
MARNYMIFDVVELTNINFTEVLETSANTLIKSIDETKTFVKWEGNTPLCVESLITKKGPYTQNEMRDVLKGIDWSKPFNI